MQIGTHKNTLIDDELDCDGQLKLEYISENDWLTEDMADDFIKHLATVFNLPIREYIEKLEAK